MARGRQRNPEKNLLYWDLLALRAGVPSPQAHKSLSGDAPDGVGPARRVVFALTAAPSGRRIRGAWPLPSLSKRGRIKTLSPSETIW